MLLSGINTLDFSLYQIKRKKMLVTWVCLIFREVIGCSLGGVLCLCERRSCYGSCWRIWKDILGLKKMMFSGGGWKIMVDSQLYYEWYWNLKECLIRL